ncbi:MAG TPA: hypothetical protein VK720_12380 [Terracidiphilus sp.]|jgi:hypothetical protein|nr:hypothetical protein [Terracidiphilus sp.]
MNQVRGIVMVIAAGIAFYRGWMLHGQRAWLAFGLGALALALAVWHFAARIAPARHTGKFTGH